MDKTLRNSTTFGGSSLLTHLTQLRDEFETKSHRFFDDPGETAGYQRAMDDVVAHLNNHIRDIMLDGLEKEFSK